MEGPFYLRIGTPGGEMDGGRFSDPVAALRQRDFRSGGPGKWVYQVLSRDTDPPETGEVEWCEGGCGTPVLASQGLCGECDAEAINE